MKIGVLWGLEYIYLDRPGFVDVIDDIDIQDHVARTFTVDPGELVMGTLTSHNRCLFVFCWIVEKECRYDNVILLNVGSRRQY
ncbi:hypothetical protein MtrunA17_Chr7g0273071 [Medicago truncatula]|uniref:Uncharacterized protein n=1 Tax=Medicago truncatula TaxID=3880 RepID=Q2HTN4_MEDTR|nr:hypothetical protein MtrDRAFT_AC150244g9v2 [Medicago truncatula]RHN49305.1 hypothetical protein MtrunA17_Chr7g0273071 [Medicago truncatula]